MRKTNYHMHTKRCMHASGSDEDYVLAAIEGGYEEIGFSDHSPWQYKSDYVAHMRMRASQFDDYYNSIKKLQEKYKNQIAIRIGLECEYFPEYMGWLKTLLVNYDMDYIIFGNHYYKTDEKRIYFGTACEDDTYLKLYVDEAIAGMKTGLYAYLAHPDLFMRGKRVFDHKAVEESYRLCIAAKELGIPLEYNLAGAEYNAIMKTERYPHKDFWRIAAEIGNTAIIGVDAHEPSALKTDTYRVEGIKRLRDLGLNITDTIEFGKFKG